MKRRKINDTKVLWGSSDGQAQGKSDSCEGDQYLQDEHVTNLHYFHQYNYILTRNYNAAAKIRVVSTRRLIKIPPRGKLDLVLIQND